MLLIHSSIHSFNNYFWVPPFCQQLSPLPYLSSTWDPLRLNWNPTSFGMPLLSTPAHRIFHLLFLLPGILICFEHLMLSCAGFALPTGWTKQTFVEPFAANQVHVYFQISFSPATTLGRYYYHSRGKSEKAEGSESLRNLLVTWLVVTVQDSNLRLVHLTLKLVLFCLWPHIPVLNFFLFSIWVLHIFSTELHSCWLNCSKAFCSCLIDIEGHIHLETITELWKC